MGKVRVYAFAGTASEEGHNDIVAEIRKHLIDPDCVIALPGPGSSGSSVNYSIATPLQPDVTRTLIELDPYNETSLFEPLAELMFGLSIDKNLERFKDQFAADVKNGYDTFVLVGWSRGAYSVIEALRGLDKSDFSKYAFSAFLIDPVNRTPRNFFSREDNLPAINEYEVVIAGSLSTIDSRIFSLYLPLLKDPDTEYRSVVLPGGHREVATANNLAGQATLNMLLRFLDKQGVATQYIPTEMEVMLSICLAWLRSRSSLSRGRIGLHGSSINDNVISAVPITGFSTTAVDFLSGCYLLRRQEEREAQMAKAAKEAELHRQRQRFEQQRIDTERAVWKAQANQRMWQSRQAMRQTQEAARLEAIHATAFTPKSSSTVPVTRTVTVSGSSASSLKNLAMKIIKRGR